VDTPKDLPKPQNIFDGMGLRIGGLVSKTEEYTGKDGKTRHYVHVYAAGSVPLKVNLIGEVDPAKHYPNAPIKMNIAAEIGFNGKDSFNFKELP